MRKVIRNAKRHWVAVAVALILPGVLAGVVEYAITKDVSGLVSLVFVVTGGILTMAVLWLMEERDPSKLQPAGPPPVQWQPHEPPIPTQPQPPPVQWQTSRQFPGKVFSPRTPAELVAEVAGKTELAAKDISRRHIGQWMRVEGTVNDVSTVSREVGVHLQPANSQPLVALWFDTDIWRARLSVLNIGDRIAAIGTIGSISSHIVSLDECELIDPPIASSS